MKPIVFIFCLLMGGSVLGQESTQPLIIVQDVLANDASHQRSSYTITASNQIQSQAQAHYQAGQAITLQAGFVAQAGSVFVATIGKVSSENGERGLMVRALGNPVMGAQADVEISGVAGQTVSLWLVDLQGHTVYEHRIQQAGQVEPVSMPLGQSRGTLLLRVSTVNQQQSIKLLRP